MNTLKFIRNYAVITILSGMAIDTFVYPMTETGHGSSHLPLNFQVTEHSITRLNRRLFGGFSYNNVRSGYIVSHVRVGLFAVRYSLTFHSDNFCEITRYEGLISRALFKARSCQVSERQWSDLIRELKVQYD